MPPRLRRRLGVGLIRLVGLALLATAAVKVTPHPAVAERMASRGITRPVLLGLVEAGCVAALLVPRTRRVGLLLCTAYLGGAIHATVTGGVVKALPAVLLQALLWTGAALATPDLLGPLLGRRDQEEPADA